jgi:hypothetical protein
VSSGMKKKQIRDSNEKKVENTHTHTHIEKKERRIISDEESRRP